VIQSFFQTANLTFQKDHEKIKVFMCKAIGALFQSASDSQMLEQLQPMLAQVSEMIAGLMDVKS